MLPRQLLFMKGVLPIIVLRLLVHVVTAGGISFDEVMTIVVVETARIDGAPLPFGTVAIEVGAEVDAIFADRHGYLAPFLVVI